MDDKPTVKGDKYWQSKLTPEQYKVLRLKDTEAPFSGKYVNNHESGMYECAACGAQLFSSETKFDSGTGWPSFDNRFTKTPLYQSGDEGEERFQASNQSGEAVESLKYKKTAASYAAEAYKPENLENVELQEDNSHGMKRTEVVCKNCGSHLGHLFDDGPTETGKRYCINSCALNFKAK